MRQRPTARRLSNFPSVSPHLVEGYGAIFNAGVIHRDGRFHLFARGVREGYRRNPGPGPRFERYVSDILRLPDGDIYLTYGAADRCVGAAVVREDRGPVSRESAKGLRRSRQALRKGC